MVYLIFISSLFLNSFFFRTALGFRIKCFALLLIDWEIGTFACQLIDWKIWMFVAKKPMEQCPYYGKLYIICKVYQILNLLNEMWWYWDCYVMLSIHVVILLARLGDSPITKLVEWRIHNLATSLISSG